MISIVICVYNGEKFIKKAIDSVLKQTFADFELIIVDDGSTDQTSNICKLYAEEDNRIRIIHQTNRGLGYSRRIGLNVAKGEWIAFLDADDWFEPNWIEDLYRETVEEPNVDIVIGNAYMCYEMNDGSIRKEERIAMSQHYVFGKEDSGFLIANTIAARINSMNNLPVRGKRSVGTVWDKLYNIEFLRENDINFIDTRLGEDMPFTSTCLTKAQKVVYSDSLGYNYLIVNSSLSHRHDYKYVQFNQDIISYYLQNLDVKLEVVRRAIAVSQVRFLMMDIERYFSYSESRDNVLRELEALIESNDFLCAISYADEKMEDMTNSEKKLFNLIRNKKYEEILKVSSWQN